MTENKPIIIDGVDVSRCKHYKNRTCIADYCITDMPFDEAKCELSPNCYFKQLARYKQTIVTIQGLAQSINDDFEEDDIEQQLSYCKDIGTQIEKICEEVLK